MTKTACALAVSAALLASFLGVSTMTAGVAQADSNQLARCHWYKQQAFKLKTDAAWKRYHDCMRGKF